MTDHFELIAAFADGERIDANELAHALATSDGREYLIDLLTLRDVIDSQTRTAIRMPQTSARPRWPWLTLAAAVLAIVTVTTGYIAGLRQGLIQSQSTRQASAPAVDVPAPAPTRVIRFERGVDWQEQIGGH